jgi:hypothetical protein
MVWDLKMKKKTKILVACILAFAAMYVICIANLQNANNRLVEVQVPSFEWDTYTHLSKALTFSVRIPSFVTYTNGIPFANYAL